MEFRLLGDLEVRIDDAPVDVGGTQPRTVLAMLLVAGGRVVPVDAIVDALWGDDPPVSASGTLQSYVSRLRRALAPGGARNAPKVLTWRAPGYALAVDHEALDAHRFEALAQQGRARLLDDDPAAAEALLDEALGLWRGPALLEFAHLDFAWGFAAKLEERRLVATEDRVEADLRLGRHAAVVGELGELVAAHPLREQLRHHLALALYRSGRQAEALRIIDDARRTLRDQLGIDPGRPLVELEAGILDQDPALAGHPETGSVAERVPAPVATPADGTPAVPAPPVGRARQSDLVGRDLELRQARAALDEAVHGVRTVIVEGEPGIGKTRLIEELADEAARRGWAVHWGRGFEGTAAPALWPWLPAVRSLVSALGPDARPAPEVARLVAADADGSGAAPTTDRTRFRLFEAVTDLVAAAAAVRPALLVVDDLQWAGLPSLELLTFLAGSLGDRPVLLAVTVRELEVGRNDAVVDTLAALSRAHGTRRISLHGLSHRATADLVAAVAGEPLPPDVVAAIQARGEGNPFFVTELARLAVAERDRVDAVELVSPGGGVPAGVRDVVRRRVGLLPEPTAALLAVAAVIGRDVDLDVLVRAAEGTADTAIDDIEPAVVHRLLAPVADRPATFHFTHALIREVVLDDVPALRRARIELRVADALAGVAPGAPASEAAAADARVDDDTAEILGQHLWAAVPLGVGARASAALERAAEVAVRRYAFEAAEEHLGRAVQLRRSVGTTPADAEAELTAISRLLSVQRSLHGYASVADAPQLQRAKQIAAEAGRVDALARLLWTEWAAYDTRSDFARAEALADEMRALGAGTDDPIVAVTGAASVGIARWHQGRVTEAAALLDEAVRSAAGITAPTTSMGLDLEVMLLPVPFARYVHVLAGDAGDAAAAEASLEALADAAPDRYAVALVEMLSAGAALAVGEPAWAERAARRGIDADPDSTFSFWGRGLAVAHAAALVELGRHEEGLPRLDAAIEAYVSGGGRTGMVGYLATRAAGLAESGHPAADDALADARRELERFGERVGEPALLEAEARVRAAHGDAPAVVAEVVQRAVDLARSQGALGMLPRLAATADRLGVVADRT